jgi:hypothetical protein
MSQQQLPAQAQGAAPVPPNVPAPAPAPAAPLAPAPPMQGAAQPNPAPAPARNRHPRGPIPAPTNNATPGVPALLELGAANPFSTEFFRSQNFFVPVAIHLFWCLGICDAHMSTTHRFLQSAPMWLPIVSQYYISVLWIYMILTVRVNAGYASTLEIHFYEDCTKYLHFQNCMIPGPLVPFFSALAASSASFDWLGDFLPGLPTPEEMLANQDGMINANWSRSVPFPAAILDQLVHFVVYTPTAPATRYSSFQWYRSIFGLASANSAPLRIGPQAAASMYVSQQQVDTAHPFWQGLIGTTAAPIYTRQTSANVELFDNFFQFCGFVDGNANPRMHTDIFNAVSRCMQTYCQYFNNSVAIRAISPTGLGATIPRGIPQGNATTRDWLYPAAYPQPRLSNYGLAIHPLPAHLGVRFEHADHELEEVAEQYAITTHINVHLGHTNNAPQNGFAAPTNNYTGDAWRMLMFRKSGFVQIHNAYGHTIAARYHLSTAARAN